MLLAFVLSVLLFLLAPQRTQDGIFSINLYKDLLQL